MKHLNKKAVPRARSLGLALLLAAGSALYSTTASAQLTPACSPTYDNSISGTGINTVNVGFLSHTPADNTHNYTSESFLASPGQTITVSVKVKGFTGIDAAADWNNDGDFADANEILLANPQYQANFNQIYDLSITIPSSVAIGSYRFRLWNIMGNSNTSATGAGPCDVYDAGTWVDYTINIVNDCSAQPTAGTISGETSVCPSKPFTLTSTGSTLAGGLESIWQQSTDNGATWTDITGSTSNILNISGGITASTQYRFKVTCVSINSTDISPAYTVDIAPGTECYCTPTNGSSNSDAITNFHLETIDNASGPNSGTGYSDFTSLSANLLEGAQYTATIQTGTGSGPHGVALWIDWNNDGTFDSGTELVAFESSIQASSTVDLDFTVPFGVSSGAHVLRVAYQYNQQGDLIDPCNNTSAYYYEAQDYTVIIVAATPCSGAPQAGTIDVNNGVTEVCANIPFAIIDTGATLAGGMTYQWQKSEDGGNTWSDIPGAVGFSYQASNGINVATQFRFIIVCNTSNLSDTSNVYNLDMAPATDCYCTPTTSFTGDYVSQFTTTNAIVNVNYTASTYPGSAYIDLHTTDTVEQSLGIPFNFTSNYQGGNHDFIVWIDWNQNGSFDDPGEEVYSDNGSTILNGQITIPNNITEGDYRMRVRGAYDYSNSQETPSCNQITVNYGTTIDFTLKVSAAPDCPQPIFLSASYESPGTSSMLSWTSNGNNFVLEWDEAGFTQGSGNLITGLTDTFTHLTGLTASTQYDFYVAQICGTGDTSNWAGPYSFYTGYCEVTNPATSSYGIANFATTDGFINIDNASGANGYTDYSAQFVSMEEGGSVNFQIDGINNSQGYGIWIDWNNDGIFGSGSEHVYNSGMYQDGAIGIINVPAGQAPGNYRMRVVSNWLSSSPQACGDLGNSGYGEAEDYTFKVVILDDCNGTVTAGNIGSDTSVCSQVGFNIIANSYTDPANGLIYQWQESTDGGNTWTDIAGEDGPILHRPNGITDETMYRFFDSCSFSQSSDYSNEITVSLNPGTDCYCDVTSTNPFGYGIIHFSTQDGYINIDNASGSNGYSNYTAQFVSMEAGGNFNFTVTPSTNSFSAYYGLWVDWNGDGSFNGPGEQVANSGSPQSGDFTGTITVPSGVTPGDYRMRVVSNEIDNPDPCGDLGYDNYGEAEDYTVNVVILDDCDGPVTAGTISNDTTICAGTSFHVTVTGYTAPANGQNYQWQQSTNGGATWTNITGANSPTLNQQNGVPVETSFRMYVECTLTNSSDTSAVMTVSMNPGNECYCTPTYTTGCSLDDNLANVNLVGNTVTLDNSTACDGLTANGYTEFFNLDTADLTIGLNYTLHVETGYSFPSSEDVRAWIDWNGNGAFEADEEILNSNGNGMDGGVDNTFTVPTTAGAGYHRMRVRVVYVGGASIDPCSQETYGEAEDYIVFVIPNCDTPIVDLGPDQVGCTGVAITLDAGNAGLDFEWNDGSTNQTLSVNQDGTYYVTVADGMCTASDTIHLSFVDPVQGTGISAVHNSDDSYTFTVENGANIDQYAWNFGDNSPNSTSSANAPTYFYGAFGDYTVTVVISNGCNSDTLQTIVHFGTDEGTGINDINVTKDNLKLFPNPAKDIITIENHSASQMEAVSVVNVLGQVIYRGDVENATKTHLNVANYAAGVYMVHIQTNKGTVVRKFEILK